MPHLLNCHPVIRNALLCLFGLILAPSPTPAAAEPEPPSAQLELKSVVLHSAGKGFFVYEAEVADETTFHIPVRRDEAGAIIRGTIVVDPASKGSISLPTASAPVTPARQLPTNQTLGDLLRSMRGQSVNVTTADEIPLQGRLVAVEMRQEVLGEHLLQREHLTLLTGKGLQSVALHEITSIDAEDDEFQARWRASLDQYSATVSPDTIAVSFTFGAADRRPVKVFLTRDVPAWKPVFLADLKGIRMRAIVDNTTETDWRDVSLALTTGSPMTFDLPLRSIGRWAGAPASLAPSSGTATNDSGDHAATGSAAPSEQDDAGGAPMIINFTKVNIPAGRTGLLDTSPKPISVGVVSHFRPGQPSTKPMLSLEIESHLPFRIPSGPVMVMLEEMTFAGEAVLPSLTRDVQHLVPIAIDEGVRVDAAPPVTETTLLALELDEAQRNLSVESVRTRRTVYQIVNGDAKPRTVLIEHPRPEAPFEVVMPETREEVSVTNATIRFQDSVLAGETRQREVREQANEQESITAAEVPLERLRGWISDPSVDQTLADQLQRILEHRLQQTNLRSQLGQHQQAIESLDEEIARVSNQLLGLEEIELSEELVRRYQARLLKLEARRDERLQSMEATQAALKAVQTQ